MAPERASASPAPTRARGRSWRSRSASRRAGSRPDASASSSSRSSPAAAPPTGPVKTRSVALPGAGPRHVRGLLAQVSDDGDGEEQDGRGDHVAARHRDAVGSQATAPSPSAMPASSSCETSSGTPELDVRLARLGAHRGEVGERDGERLVPDRVRGKGGAPEVDAVDERVHRGDAVPRGSTTAASSPLPTITLIARRAPAAAMRSRRSAIRSNSPSMPRQNRSHAVAGLGGLGPLRLSGADPRRPRDLHARPGVRRSRLRPATGGGHPPGRPLRALLRGPRRLLGHDGPLLLPHDRPRRAPHPPRARVRALPSPARPCSRSSRSPSPSPPCSRSRSAARSTGRFAHRNAPEAREVRTTRHRTGTAS